MTQGSTTLEYFNWRPYYWAKKNKNIRAKTTRDVKLLIEFLRKKKQGNLEHIEYICKFILSVKRKDGKDFEPSSVLEEGHNGGVHVDGWRLKF